jgi:hypothetical protein
MAAQVAVPKDNPHLQIGGDDAMRQTRGAAGGKLVSR